MRAIILVLLCSLTASAQTVTLPTWLIDSMSYEVRLGRQCNEVMKAQSIELQKQGQELAHVNKALKLYQSESKTLESLVSNTKESQNLDFQQYALDLGKEKRKKRKWIKVAIVQTVVIVALILTPDI